MGEHKFNLGDRVRETITGFTGIACGRCEYLWGCITYEVKAEEVHDDGKIKDFWFDEDRLVLVATAEEVAKKKTPVTPNRAGGPQADAPAHSS